MVHSHEYHYIPVIGSFLFKESKPFMKCKKHPFRILTWILSLLLATSGLAQGLDVCKGECCEKALKAEKKDVLQQKPFHEGTFDFKLPLCNLHSEIVETLGLSLPEEKPDDAPPVCCHLKKAEQNVQGLTSPTSSSNHDRFTVVGIHSFLSDLDLINGPHNQAIAGYTIHPRAAPVPLYLKNASFLC